MILSTSSVGKEGSKSREAGGAAMLKVSMQYSSSSVSNMNRSDGASRKDRETSSPS